MRNLPGGENGEVAGRQDSPRSEAKQEDAGRCSPAAAETVGEQAEARKDAGGGDANAGGGTEALKREIAGLKLKVETGEAENAALRSELDLVRKGLGELLDKLQEKDRRLQALELKYAELLEPEGTGGGEREVRLMARLNELTNRGEALARSLSEYCKQADSLMEVSGVDELRKAQLLVARDSLLGELRKFSVASGGVEVENPDVPFKSTRVYSVNRDLGLVVLPVGINHGAFHGLLLYGVGKAPVQLRIVSVRPFVSGAVVISGDIADVTGGMELVADVNKIQKK
ncbi:MAG: hypothetical protein PHI85_05365 [Victivallaceae bacterium]|nr:hypothetical protein [Victivallaceae bacterium]